MEPAVLYSYVLQYRSYYFNLFTQNLCTSSLKFLRNKSCSLSSLLFTSLCLEFSSSPQKHFSLSYSCCKLKKNHSIVSLFFLELKPLADKLPHLQGVVVFWILITIIPLPLITVSCFQPVQGDNCYIPQWKRNMLFYIHPPMSSCLMLEILPVRNRNFVWFVLAQNGTQLS